MDESVTEPTVRLFLWPNRLLIIGPGVDTAPHVHHAAQLCVGLSAPIRLRGASSTQWKTAWGFFVPPNVLHQLDASASSTAFLYLEPEGAEYLAYREAFGGAERTHALSHTRTLRELSGGISRVKRCEDAARLARALLGMGEGARQPKHLDERVNRAVVWIGNHLEDPVRLRTVAEAAGASESHLAHLFRAQVGLPIRRYVLWRRLRVAIGHVLAGQTLTDAAHEAGFADAAHLSRTFRAMFGITPSAAFFSAGPFAAVIC